MCFYQICAFRSSNCKNHLLWVIWPSPPIILYLGPPVLPSCDCFSIRTNITQIWCSHRSASQYHLWDATWKRRKYWDSNIEFTRRFVIATLTILQVLEKHFFVQRKLWLLEKGYELIENYLVLCLCVLYSLYKWRWLHLIVKCFGWIIERHWLWNQVLLMICWS